MALCGISLSRLLSNLGRLLSLSCALLVCSVDRQAETTFLLLSVLFFQEERAGILLKVGDAWVTWNICAALRL